MIVSRNPNRVQALILTPVVLLCAMIVQPVGEAVAQDMQAVSSRLEAAGNKIRAATESGEYGPYEAIAKWHEIKEKIVTGAIAGDEITEAEAVLLRIKLVEAEARERSKAIDSLVAGPITAAQIVAGMDKNGDGKISQDEASDDLKPHFATVDTNGDGVIDVKEAQVMADYANQMIAEKSATPAAGRFTAEFMINYMDKNGDGKISKDEASDDLKPHFETLDTNGDGVIDVKEAQPMADYANQIYGSTSPAPAAEQTLSKMDKNGDGKITKDEASEDLKLFFGQYDVNKDGVIDAKEAKALEKYAKSPKAASSKPDPAAGRVTAAQIVGYMDKNNDEKISREEASEELKPHFDQIDTNKDGVIDVKEAQVMADYVNNQQSSK